MLISDIPREHFDLAASQSVRSIQITRNLTTGAWPDNPFYLLVVEGFSQVPEPDHESLPERGDFDDESGYVAAVVKQVRLGLLGEYGIGDFQVPIPGVGLSPYEIAHLKIRTTLRFGYDTHTAVMWERNLRPGDTRTFGSSRFRLMLTPDQELNAVTGASGWEPEADYAAADGVKGQLLLILTQAGVIPRPQIDSPAFLLGEPPYQRVLLTPDKQPWSPPASGKQV